MERDRNCVVPTLLKLQLQTHFDVRIGNTNTSLAVEAVAITSIIGIDCHGRP